MQFLHGSVGLRATNRTADVVAVQRLLNAAEVPCGPIDGRCGRLTIHAIERFQHGFLKRPDGRVDVRGPTWRKLVGETAVPAVTRPATSTSAAPPRRAVPPVVRLPRVGSVAAAPVPAGARSGSVAAQAVQTVPTPRPAETPAPARRPATPAAPASKAFWMTPTALPARGTVNRGLSSPGPASQIARFGGRPSETLYRNGGPVTNPKLKALLVLENVGPFRVQGLRPAVASLRGVLGAVARDIPDLYRLLGNAGMLVNRLQRGSSTKLSNHAFGTAIDFYIGGVLTQRGSNSSSRGLDTLAPYFNRAGWYWGATFSTDDAMHFECGTALLDSFGI